MKNITKTKKAIKMGMKGKVKASKKPVTKAYDKVESTIQAAIKKSGKVGYYHFSKGCAAYRAIAYFMAHKPVEGKVYKAKDVLGDYDRKEPFVRRNVQKMILLVHSQFKKVVAIKWVKGFKNKFTEFKLTKKVA
jgi:hypothetical protein